MTVKYLQQYYDKKRGKFGQLILKFALNDHTCVSCVFCSVVGQAYTITLSQE